MPEVYHSQFSTTSWKIVPSTQNTASGLPPSTWEVERDTDASDFLRLDILLSERRAWMSNFQ